MFATAFGRREKCGKGVMPRGIFRWTRSWPALAPPPLKSVPRYATEYVSSDLGVFVKVHASSDAVGTRYTVHSCVLSDTAGGRMQILV